MTTRVDVLVPPPPGARRRSRPGSAALESRCLRRPRPGLPHRPPPSPAQLCVRLDAGCRVPVVSRTGWRPRARPLAGRGESPAAGGPRRVALAELQGGTVSRATVSDSTPTAGGEDGGQVRRPEKSPPGLDRRRAAGSRPGLGPVRSPARRRGGPGSHAAATAGRGACRRPALVVELHAGRTPRSCPRAAGRRARRRGGGTAHGAGARHDGGAGFAGGEGHAGAVPRRLRRPPCCDGRRAVRPGGPRSQVRLRFRGRNTPDGGWCRVAQPLPKEVESPP